MFCKISVGIEFIGDKSVSYVADITLAIGHLFCRTTPDDCFWNADIAKTKRDK